MAGRLHERHLRELVSGQRARRADGFVERWHSHECGQLVWSPTGVQLVQTDEHVWVTPGSGAVWIPPRTYHRPMSVGTGWEHDLYLDRDLCEQLPARACLVSVSPVLRAAIGAALARLESGVAPEAERPVLMANIRDSGIRPLPNPLPRRDGSLLSIETATGTAPLPVSLSEWAELSGLAPKSFRWALQRDTARPFRTWRQQMRLLRALLLLAAGESLTRIPMLVGYGSSSHLVASFRQRLGVTPNRYFRPLLLEPAAHPSQAQPPEPSPAVHVALARRAAVRVRAFVSEAPSSPDGNYVSAHEHDSGELLWSPSGVLTVGSARGTWVVNAARGVWVPRGERHDLLEWGGTQLHCYFIDADAQELPTECCAVDVSERLRSALHGLAEGRHGQEREASLSLRELRAAPLAPLPLPFERARRLAPLVGMLRQDPIRKGSTQAWARWLGMSPRAFARHCESELELSFGRFRRLLLVRFALEQLSAGSDVSSVAARAGYRNVSMFIAMFRRVTGTTPGRYLHDPLIGERRAREPG